MESAQTIRVVIGHLVDMLESERATSITVEQLRLMIEALEDKTKGKK